ncbi:hypothetical protein D3C81_1696100 [compost metagenome]
MHRIARQHAVTQQDRQPILTVEVAARGLAMQTCLFAVAAQGVQGAEQCLPVRQQTLVAPGVGQGQESAQLLQASLGFIQPTAEQQRLGTQVDQPRAAFQQVRCHSLAPGHEPAQVLFAQDPGQPQALHVAGGDFRLLCAQRLLDRIIQVSQGAECLAGAQAQTIQRGRRQAFL